jgi:ABC-type amino acid transport system permease subunit
MAYNPSSMYLLDLNPLIEGVANGFDLLFDFVVELFPIIILLGIIGILFLAFRFGGKGRGTVRVIGVFRIIPVIVLLSVLFFGIAFAAGAGETITSTKDQIKANMPTRFNAGGLTASTYYTLYIANVMKSNKSTSASGTQLEFKTTIGDEYVGQYVAVQLKDAAGAVVLATLTMEVVDVIPQHTIDMLGSLFPLIMVFGVVLFAVSGIPAAIIKRIQGL